MVDVTEKKETTRTAIAQGKIKVNDEIFEKVKEGSMAKGDVLGTARIAGIMAAKKTFELIPMCHLLMLTKCKVDFEMLEETKEIKAVCLVKTTGKTGVEMEALTAASVAALRSRNSGVTCTSTRGRSWHASRTSAGACTRAKVARSSREGSGKAVPRLRTRTRQVEQRARPPHRDR